MSRTSQRGNSRQTLLGRGPVVDRGTVEPVDGILALVPGREHQPRELVAVGYAA